MTPDRRLSYAEAESRSALLARGLLAEGLGKGSRVGVLFPNGPEWVLAFLAATRIGAVLVPLNTFSRARELAFALRHADVDTLLACDRFLGHDYLARLEECAPGLSGSSHEPLALPELPLLRRVLVFGACDRSWAREGPARLAALARERRGFGAALLEEIERCVAPADPLAIVYSSGSAAEPKGAVFAQGPLLRYVARLLPLRGLGPDDRVYTGMPFFWTGGFVYALLGCLQAGATLLSQASFEAGAALELMERERATLALGWPHTAKAMAEHPSFATRDLRSLRGGNLYAILPEALRPASPEHRANSLGMTETGGPHCFGDLDAELPPRLRGTFGRPVPGIEHRIADPRTGETLPPGADGEILVRGPNLMLGLHKVEREACFDPDGFYHTGDGGHFDAEGHLHFAGRLGETIKTRGANVSPREVELVLEALPEVKHAYVVGLADPVEGQVVIAAVALNEGSAIAAEALRERAAAGLSAYKLPRHILFFAAAELPFLDSAKIDKRRLAELVAARLGSAA